MNNGQNGICPPSHGKAGRGMSIGLFGGTFDPVHYGHVALAETIRKRLQLDEVWFLISPQNPWKQDSHITDDDLRYQMVRLALADNEHLQASDYEFHLPKPSYTYQTLRHLRADFPEHEFTLIVGGDNWAAFDHWAEYGEILQHHPIAVFPRQGMGQPPLPSYPEARIVVLDDVGLMPVSSTEIRQRVADGLSIETLVAPAVADFIRTNNLYR